MSAETNNNNNNRTDECDLASPEEKEKQGEGNVNKDDTVDLLYSASNVNLLQDKRKYDNRSIVRMDDDTTENKLDGSNLNTTTIENDMDILYDDELVLEEEEEDEDEEDASDEDIDDNDEECLSFSDELATPSSYLTLEDLSRTFSSNVSYFYLKNELQLPETTLWRITYEAGSALGMTTSTIRRKIDVLRDSMNLSDDEIRTILERHPTILHLSVDKNIAPTILFLIRTLDLGRDELRTLVVSGPCILSYSRRNLMSKINFFTRVMGYTIDECRALFLKEPKLFRASVRTGLVPKMRFLVRDIEIGMDDLRIIVYKHPRILLYSLDHNLIPKLIYYCIMKLNMTTSQIHKLLLSYPDVLHFNLDRHIVPITEYFVHDLGISVQEFAKILLKFPRLLTHSIYKIKHVVGYLRYEIGLSASQIKRILYQAPQIISLNTDITLKGKVEYLKSNLGIVEDDDLRRLLAGMPTLLILSTTNNLEPKLHFLRESLETTGHSGGGGKKKTKMSIRSKARATTKILRGVVLRTPALLGYSLEKRIRPRMEAILDAEVDPTAIAVAITFKDIDFGPWLERQKQRTQEMMGMESTPINDLLQQSPYSVERTTRTDRSMNRDEDNDGDDNASSNPRIMHWKRERRRIPPS